MSRRNCSTVIAEMLSKIPKTKDNDDFIGHLKWNLEDASYKAPEQNIQWKRTQQTLIKHIPKPIEDWEYEVLSVFTTKTVEELKLLY